MNPKPEAAARYLQEAAKSGHHRSREFLDLHVTYESQIAGEALHFLAALYEIEPEANSWSRKFATNTARKSGTNY